MLRRTLTSRSGSVCNCLAPAHSGRWFNPPHQWTIVDVVQVPGACAMLFILLYGWYLMITLPPISNYTDKNYVPNVPYTKEFNLKYNRAAMWKWY